MAVADNFSKECELIVCSRLLAVSKFTKTLSTITKLQNYSTEHFLSLSLNLYFWHFKQRKSNIKAEYLTSLSPCTSADDKHRIPTKSIRNLPIWSSTSAILGAPPSRTGSHVIVTTMGGGGRPGAERVSTEWWDFLQKLYNFSPADLLVFIINKTADE